MDIIEVCLSVRAGIEKFNQKSEYWPEDLLGACAITSVVLMLKLKEKGYDAKLVHGSHPCYFEDGIDRDEFDQSNHCWVEVDKEIYDLTATQFGRWDVVFTTSIFSRDGDKYHNKQYLSEDNIWSHFWRWDYNQRPSKENIQEILEEAKHEFSKN